MNTKIFGTGIVGLALLTGTAYIASAQPTKSVTPPAVQTPVEEADETPIKLADAPEAVRAAIAKLAPADKVKKVVKEDQDGVMVFEAEYTSADGVDHSASISPSGHVMEIETVVKESAVPAAIMAALKKAHPNATFKDHTQVQEFFYEVDVVENGKSKEIKIDAMGRVKDAAPVVEEKDEKPAKGK